MESVLLIFIVVIAMGVTLLIRHNDRLQKRRDADAARQTYEHITGPILVTSDFPDDSTVMQRAEAWRQKLRAAGNPYSEVMPIVPYPFALGASETTGALRTWLTYRHNCLLKEQALIAEWEQKMQKENNPLYSGHILNQK